MDAWEEIDIFSDTQESCLSDNASDLRFYETMAGAAKFLEVSKI